MRRTLIYLLLLVIVFLPGCIKPRIIEDLGIINARGVDIADDDKVQTTLVIFKFNNQMQNTTEIIEGKGNTIKNARKNANYKTSFSLDPGQIHLELYGKAAAEKGILRYLDTLVRDARVSDTMYLAVSGTTANEIITKGEGESSVNVGQYIHDIIEQSVKGNIIPRMTLQDFLHVYYDRGMDPFLPLLSIRDDIPILSALAIFHNDKQVGQIPINKAYLITMLHQSIESTSIEVPLPIKPFKKYMGKSRPNETQGDNFYVTLTIINGKSKTKMTNIENLSYQTKVNLDVSVLELTEEVNMKNNKVIHVFEKEIAKEIKHQYEQLLAKLQEMNADPFGYGEIYRTEKASGHLKKDAWHDQFPGINVDFNVKVNVVRHGTIP